MSNCISNLFIDKIFDGCIKRNAAFQQGRMSHGEYVRQISASTVGFLAFTAAAIVETVAYSFITLATLPLCLINNKPFNFFARLVTLSSSCIFKGLALSFMNFFSLFWLQPQQDREELNIPVPPYQRQHEPNEGNELVNQGADFITQEVLADVTPEIVSLVRDMDPEMYMFILTKAVSIYTIGNKRNDPLPEFFKSETRDKITHLRRELPEAISANLLEVVKDLEKQEIGPETEIDKNTFAHLREIAYGEFRGLFISQCLQKAGQQIPGVEAEDFYANAI